MGSVSLVNVEDLVWAWRHAPDPERSELLGEIDNVYRKLVALSEDSGAAEPDDGGLEQALDELRTVAIEAAPELAALNDRVARTVEHLDRVREELLLLRAQMPVAAAEARAPAMMTE